MRRSNHLRTQETASLCSYRGCGSRLFVVWRGKSAQRLDRWDEVVGSTDRCRVPGEGITDAILGSGHAREHAGQALLVTAETDEHRPMLGGRSERRIAAEDVLFDPILFDRCARDMGLWAASLFS